MNFEDYITIDYTQQSGHFLIIYSPVGQVSLYAYGRRSTDEDAALIARGLPLPPIEVIIPSSFRGWSHDCDVESDLFDLTSDQIAVKYRRIFLESHIDYLGIDTPAQGDLARAVFPVVMVDSRRYDVVLRTDGIGYVVDTLHYRPHGLRIDVSYTAEVPIAFFMHPVDAATISKDAGALVALRDSPVVQDGVDRDCPVQDLARQDMSSPQGAAALARHYENLFWVSLNPGMNCPFMRFMSEKDHVPLVMRRGDLASFKTLMARACRLDSQAWSDDVGNIAIIANSAVNDEIACLLRAGDSDFLSASTISLLDVIVGWHNPFGYFIRGNRETAIRWLRLQKDPHTIMVTVDAPSSSDRMEDLEHLIAWSEQNGIDIGQYLPD